MLATRLTLGNRLTFVGGKGGVGKTTIAAALAVEIADSGEHPTIISVDPAHSLGDAFASQLGPDPTPLPALPAISAAEVDAALEQQRFISKYGALIRQLIERGTYLDASDVEEISAGTMPGLDEIAALLTLQRITNAAAGRLIVDTAPTGHALRLLELPELVLGWIATLEAMDEKHIAVASAIASVYRPDAASDFLAQLRLDVAGFGRLLRDPDATRFLLVTTSEPVVLAETYRFQDRLEQLGIAAAGIVVNRSGSLDDSTRGVLTLPLLERSPRGVEALRSLTAAHPAAGTEALAAEWDDTTLQPGSAYRLPTNHQLYLVVGKGGVGKSTAAASIAITLARSDRRVLLLSVDPAGSLGDVLGQDVAATPTPVEGIGGLEVRQMDAAGSWNDFRNRYRDDVESVFAGPIGGSSAILDRAVLERLLDLSPAGLDELVALLEVIDANEDRVYDAIVLDTAPTGHLLRLLEMPGVALEWTHSLLRLLLKYREVVHLGGTGERVLRLAKSLRRIQALLRDPEATCFVVVTLADPLSIAETTRLLPELDELGSGAGALVVNRVLGVSGGVVRGSEEHLHRLAALRPGLPLIGAPVWENGPRGPDELRDFINGWRVIEKVPSTTES